MTAELKLSAVISFIMPQKIPIVHSVGVFCVFELCFVLNARMIPVYSDSGIKDNSVSEV